MREGRVHFIGIGGAGMSAIAAILVAGGGSGRHPGGGRLRSPPHRGEGHVAGGPAGGGGEGGMHLPAPPRHLHRRPVEGFRRGLEPGRPGDPHRGLCGGENPRPGVNAKLILDALLEDHPRHAAVYIPMRAELGRSALRLSAPGRPGADHGGGRRYPVLPRRSGMPSRRPDKSHAHDDGRYRFARKAGRGIPGARGGAGAGEDPHRARAVPPTTFHVGGPASVVAIPYSREELDHIRDTAAACGLPLKVLGRGSNILAADRGYRGVILLVVTRGIRQPPILIKV